MIGREGVRLRLLLAFLFLLAPSIIRAQTEALDLTAQFRAAGIEIDRLIVIKVSDIVLIRGRTSDVAMAACAESFARGLGYLRVANLIEIVPGLADSEIERIGALALDMEPGLEGCSFQIHSVGGVVRLRGRIHSEIQGDRALALLSKIEGVSAVHPELTTIKTDK